MDAEGLTALRNKLVDVACQYGAPDPEDVAQDVLLKLWLLGKLEATTLYIVRAARNAAITQHRRAAYRRYAPLADLPDRHLILGTEPLRLPLAPDELEWLLAYHDHPPRQGFHSGRDTVRAHRLRAKARLGLRGILAAK